MASLGSPNPPHFVETLPSERKKTYILHFQKGRKRAGVKGAGVANCRIFRSAVPSVVVWSILLVSLSGGEEKVMTIYDAGPLAAGPLCGLLTFAQIKKCKCKSG